MKTRLDIALVERGLCESRQQAQGLIMAGLVDVDGRRADKAGLNVSPDAVIHVQQPEHPYVSRGGLKLQKALDDWNINVLGAVALDVGASTGGFTHCLLLRGAVRVYAIDVGYGQLDYRLRQDARVICKERVNARYLTAEHVPERVNVAVMDVSFISLSLVIPAVVPLLLPEASVVALVKPQFEAGRGQVGRGGVVREPEVHREVLVRTAQHVSTVGLCVRGVTPSPVRGPSGNVEFLMWLGMGAVADATSMIDRAMLAVADVPEPRRR